MPVVKIEGKLPLIWRLKILFSNNFKTDFGVDPERIDLAQFFMPQKAHLVLSDGQVRHLCDGITAFQLRPGGEGKGLILQRIIA